MRIVVINGQNHKGSTYHIGYQLVEQIREQMSGEEIVVTEFFLPRDLNHFCVGCYTCVEDESGCPYYEEKNRIMQVVEQADLLIFTTPNYCMAPSAPLKAFMDLTFTYWFSHKPRACMFEKRAIVISTTAGAGSGLAIKPVKRMLLYWGVPWIKSFGIGVQAMNWEGVSEKKRTVIERKVDKMAKKVVEPIERHKKPHIPWKSKFLFNMMCMMQSAGMGSGETERRYWEEQGWLKGVRPWKTRRGKMEKN